MPTPILGLALGSGAARGWAHIGVLECLRREGIEPDIVCGASIGALVGAAFAKGKLGELKAYAEQLNRRGVIKMLDVGLSGGGIINGRMAVELLRELGVSGPIEACAKPFAAVATDLESGREIWLREGAIEEAVRASISIPGVLSPVRLEDRWLADGALVNPVPVSLCRAMGAEVIVAVHLNGDGVQKFGLDAPEPSESESPQWIRRAIEQAPAMVREQAAAVASRLFPAPSVSPGYFDVLLNAINIMEDQITRARLAGEPPHVLLTPRLRSITVMDFDRAKEAIAEGFAAMEDALPALRRHL